MANASLRFYLAREFHSERTDKQCYDSHSHMLIPGEK